MNLFGKTITSEIEVLPSALQVICRKTITEMEQSSSQSINVERFCQDTMESIHRAFNLYSVNLYTVEAKDGWVVLQAGTSKLAQEAKQKDHKLPIDGNSLVGKVAQTSQGYILLNKQVQINYPSPMFPPVHSELAMPIILPQNRLTVGVLDVLSDEYEAFGKDEYMAFSIIANCIALVFSDTFPNERLL